MQMHYLDEQHKQTNRDDRLDDDDSQEQNCDEGMVLNDHLTAISCMSNQGMATSSSTSSRILIDDGNFESVAPMPTPTCDQFSVSLDVVSLSTSDPYYDEEDLSLPSSREGQSRSSSGNSSLQPGWQAVPVMRVMVITVLLTMAAIASNLVYLMVLHQEEDNFKHHFVSGQAQDVLRTLQRQFQRRVYWAANDLAQNLLDVADRQSGSRQWPFVYIYEFESLVKISGVLLPSTNVWFSPIVSDYDREEWERFAEEIMRGRDQFGNASSLVLPSNDFPAYLDDMLPMTPSSLVTYRDVSAWKHDNPNVLFRIRNGIPEPIPESSMPTDQRATSSYFPVWQGTAMDDRIWCYDQLSEPSRRHALTIMIQTRKAVWTELHYKDGNADSIHLSYASPTSGLYFPIERQKSDNGSSDSALLLGAVLVEIDWISLFRTSFLGLKSTEHSLIAVLETTGVECENLQQYSFEISNHGGATFLGPGDFHDNTADAMPVSTVLRPDGEYVQASFPFASITQVCDYRITLYPTHITRDTYLTTTPHYYQAATVIIFLASTALFIVYDCRAEHRQKEVVRSAKRTNAIVHSLFPRNIRERLYAEQRQQRRSAAIVAALQTPKLRLKSFLDGGADADCQGGNKTDRQNRKNSQRSLQRNGDGIDSEDIIASEPIADLFPHATVMFADVAGFTAWSSEREPVQVFSLLEGLYGSMDVVARKLGVFKVETVGDCYVAATGLPDPREDHAVLMLRFANTCLFRIRELVQVLESSLGPGTADLAMRFGIHSGPVTAGVLRGEKSRFQLFGDTMNTAARMESTGMPNEIHLSKSTADLLKAAGKGRWLVRRDGLVVAKGKGELQTYWVRLKREKVLPTVGSTEKDTDQNGLNVTAHNGTLVTPRSMHRLAEKQDVKLKKKQDDLKSNAIRDRLERLIKWNVEELLSILKCVVARRRQMQALSNNGEATLFWPSSSMSLVTEPPAPPSASPLSGPSIDEFREVVTIPPFNPRIPGQISVELDDEVHNELKDYISQIAEGYKTANSFHNFEHASHVCMSAGKLLRRIVHSDAVDYSGSAVARDLHYATYGISSDPLTHFAVVLSALIHDVGHTGVPNRQLAVEHPEIAAKYRNQSIAEQRSVDMAWELLSAPCYDRLRECIFSTDRERTQFRQLVVNSVLATDIFDKQMTALRKARWQRAFYGSGDPHSSILQTIVPDDTEEDRNRKATIVIEHIIQASDVAHTMQHWHIYNRWNERLFCEMHAAFVAGRSTENPADGWYKGELWFFDNYVIPLAYKLKDCGVFGVSSDEYLNYAVANREEWSRKGEQVVQEYIEKYSVET